MLPMNIISKQYYQVSVLNAIRLSQPYQYTEEGHNSPEV